MKKILLSLLSLLIILPIQSVNAETENKVTFSDVSDYYDYSLAIDTLKENKVVSGFSDGSFKPDNTITRAEFAKIVVNALNNNPDVSSYEGKKCFPDVAITDALNPYICYAVEKNILKGYDDGTFKPSKPIAFHEASKIILKTSEKDLVVPASNWEKTILKKMSDNNNIPSTIKDVKKSITRGEMAELIMRETEPSDSYESSIYSEEKDIIAEDLPKVATCDYLEKKLKEVRPYPILYEMARDEASTGSSNKATEASPEASVSDYSTTNVQVEGVDEADTVKNDGENIYVLRNDKITIIKASPAKNMDVVGEIKFDSNTFSATEMYLDGDYLVVIGNSYTPYVYASTSDAVSSKMIMPYFNSSRVTVKTYDIENPEKPILERTIDLDGYLSSSRKVGDYIYLVSNVSPYYQIFDEDTYNVESILPKMKDSAKGSTEEVQAKCADIRIIPPVDNPSFLTISAIPIKDLDMTIDREVILGTSENIYASKENIYVVSTHYNNIFYPIGVRNMSVRPSVEKTQITKFAIDEGDIDFKSQSKVPGRILNQFSMDEYDGNFRIATTLGESWFGSQIQSKNNVYVLDSDMNMTGKLEGLAKGERIYSVRFMGKRAYIVTFKNVDPLFVIDLEDENNPKVLGELKIPGYSEYLHPYDENHIIGFGKDAVEVKTQAYDQGMKLAIFDVTDVNSPKQMFSELIGDRGTQSELLYNHKALLFNKAKGLLAFPITVAKVASGSDKSAYGQTVFEGAYIYNVDLKNGFTLKAKKTHYDSDTQLIINGDYYYDYTKKINRIVYIDDELYTISQSMIKAYDLDNLNDISKVTY